MFEYTKNNHINYHLTDNDFCFNHGKCYSHSSWRDECKRVAQELYDLHGNNLVLMLSGGLDSEVVFHSFLSLGIKPKVAILKYERNLNLHDINYALRLCASRYISPVIVDVNVKNFFESELLNFANLTKCSSPQINLLLYQANKIDGIPILASGENFLVRKEGQSKIYDLEESKIISIYDFFIKNSRESIPAFFQYTPEVMLSYLQRESIYSWVENAKKDGYINSKKIKPSIIAEEFDIEPRGKLTGFELMGELDYKYRTILQEKNLSNELEQWTIFDDYIRSFGVDLIREIEYVKT
jgi:hypothetical protein